jgi:hypothetical protein
VSRSIAKTQLHSFQRNFIAWPRVNTDPYRHLRTFGLMNHWNQIENRIPILLGEGVLWPPSIMARQGIRKCPRDTKMITCFESDREGSDLWGGFSCLNRAGERSHIPKEVPEKERSFASHRGRSITNILSSCLLYIDVQKRCSFRHRTAPDLVLAIE